MRWLYFFTGWQYDSHLRRSASSWCYTGLCLWLVCNYTVDQWTHATWSGVGQEFCDDMYSAPESARSIGTSDGKWSDDPYKAIINIINQSINSCCGNCIINPILGSMCITDISECVNIPICSSSLITRFYTSQYVFTSLLSNSCEILPVSMVRNTENVAWRFCSLRLSKICWIIVSGLLSRQWLTIISKTQSR